MELLKNSKDKRARKLAKRRVRTIITFNSFLIFSSLVPSLALRERLKNSTPSSLKAVVPIKYPKFR